MNSPRNSELTPLLISSGILLFGLVIMLAPFLLALDMMQWGFGLIFLGFFVVLTGVISLSIFLVRFRKVKRMLTGNDVLVRWTHSPDIYEEQVARDYQARRKRNGAKLAVMLFFIITISAVMVAIGINSGESDAMPLFVGIMGTVAGVLVLVAFLAPRWDRKRALRNARETVISENGLYTQGTLYTWGKVAARLRGVSLREEKGRNHLVFSIDAAAQVGVPQYINHIVEVPVPDGEEAAARDLVDRLSRQCDSGQD